MVFIIIPAFEQIEGEFTFGRNIIVSLSHLLLVFSAESIELSYS